MVSELYNHRTNQKLGNWHIDWSGREMDKQPRQRPKNDKENLHLSKIKY